MNNTEGTTAALESATPSSCQVFSWCATDTAEHGEHDVFHVSAVIDRWTMATPSGPPERGDISVFLEAYEDEEAVEPPTINISGKLGRGSQDLAELHVSDAQRLARAIAAAIELAEASR